MTHRDALGRFVGARGNPVFLGEPTAVRAFVDQPFGNPMLAVRMDRVLKYWADCAGADWRIERERVLDQAVRSLTNSHWWSWGGLWELEHIAGCDACRANPVIERDLVRASDAIRTEFQRLWAAR